MENTIAGVFRSKAEVEQAIENLNGQGYQAEDITLITNDQNDLFNDFPAIPVIQIPKEYNMQVCDLILDITSGETVAKEIIAALKQAAEKYILLIEEFPQHLSAFQYNTDNAGTYA